MANTKKAGLIALIGRKKAGATVTKEVRAANGGKGIALNTLSQWVKQGLLHKEGRGKAATFTLTDKAIEHKAEAKG